MTAGAIIRIVILTAAAVLAALFASRLGRRGRPIAAFAVRRLLWLVLTTLAVFTLSFFLVRAVPGGPFESERGIEPSVRRALEARYRLDDPVAVQFGEALGDLLALDLGPSMRHPDFSVAEIIAHGAPASAALGIAALFWTLALGLPAGIVAAWCRGRLADRVLMGLATLGIAVPSFVLAGILLVLLVFRLGLLPAGGLSSAADLLLPSFCLGAPFAAQVARLARTALLEVSEQDWIRTARAKGLSESQVVIGHALPAALIPVVVFLGPALAGILTGSLVIEQVFAIPGLGTHFVQSAINRDYTLALGLVVLYTSLLFALNTLADLFHALLDPRVELAR